MGKTTCEECGAVVFVDDVIYCTCGARLCDHCYQSWHREHNKNAEPTPDYTVTPPTKKHDAAQRPA